MSEKEPGRFEGPWRRGDGSIIMSNRNPCMGYCCDDELADRIVACVNALEGMVPGELAGVLEAAMDMRECRSDIRCECRQKFDAALARLRREKDDRAD